MSPPIEGYFDHEKIVLKMPTNSKLQFNDVTSIGTYTPGMKQEAFNRYLSK